MAKILNLTTSHLLLPIIASLAIAMSNSTIVCFTLFTTLHYVCLIIVYLTLLHDNFYPLNSNLNVWILIVYY